MPALLFPYFITFILAGVTIPVAEWASEWLLFHWQIILFLYILALGCSIITFIISISRKWRVQELLRVNMIIKLLHIPAYTLITISTISVILWAGPEFILMAFFGYMTIFLTGLIGLCGIIRGFKENRFSMIGVIIHGILQFVPLLHADAISAIIVYRKSRE